jgi:glycosyltransferase involved in cell wall biosynthesis
MHKHELSAVILASNSERTIADCLRAAVQVSNDIIVVLDSLSTDRTEAISDSFGARVIRHEWKGFSAAKNMGVSLATCDWILCPDADEVLDDDLILAIQQLKPESVSAYLMNILTWFGPHPVRHCGWFPDWNIRLFNRTIMHWDHRRVHEKLVSDQPVTMRRVHGIINHFSFRDEAHMKEKFDYYARLRAQEWIHQGKKPPFLKRLVGPAFRFFRTYILKRGWLDGRTGLTIATCEYELKKKELQYWKMMKSKS